MRNTLVAIAVLSFTLSSCHGWFGHQEKGNGNITTETRDVKNFDAIDVSAGIDVYVKQDSTESVKVVIDANLQQYIITEVEGSVLFIHPASNVNINSSNNIKVYVSAKTFKRFEASSSSDIRGEGKIQSSDEIFIKASSAADIELDIKSPKVTGDISSSGTMKLSGETKDLFVEASSGSSAKCFDLLAENTEARVSSGANADVFASIKLNGKASSGASINYKGNASSSVETSSGGSVNKLN